METELKKAVTGPELAAQEYDEIAAKYQEATKREFRIFTLEATFRKFFSELKNKQVLDLACGEGYSSRLAKEMGAEKVIGIDISKKEIEMAKEIEKERQEQIEYFVRDATKDFSDLGKFDIVMAVNLLHYCPDLDTLNKLAKNISNALKTGGEFITITANPDFMTDYEGYGVTMKSDSGKEGEPFTTTLRDFEGNVYCSFTNYYWRRETYQEILEKNGFVVDWEDSFVSQEGIDKYGEEFWADYKKRPVYVIIKAKLKS